MSWPQLVSSRIELAAAPEAVRCARHWIAAQFARTDSADLVDTAMLLVSELVTNAVQASKAVQAFNAAANVSDDGEPPRIGLTVARTRDTVRIEVTDSDCGSFPVLSSRTDEDECGRGLQVITALSKQWGCRAVYRGKVVWCELATTVPLATTGAPVAAVPGDHSKRRPVAVRPSSPVAVCADITSQNGT